MYIKYSAENMNTGEFSGTFCLETTQAIAKEWRKNGHKVEILKYIFKEGKAVEVKETNF